MLRLGLTGGIASGKSTVAGILHEMGFAVLDADSLAHRLMEPGHPAYQEIAREFGSAVFDGNGRVDRARLAKIVFADRAKLERLNAIVHPRVEMGVARQFREWSQSGKRDAAFVEAALLVEAGYHKNLDGLVVTWSTRAQQIERLKARGFSEEDAVRRIDSQMPVDEKLRYATEKIDCSGSLEETRRQVQDLVARIRSGAIRVQPIQQA
jgi:dephospho-CoA kinase